MLVFEATAGSMEPEPQPRSWRRLLRRLRLLLEFRNESDADDCVSYGDLPSRSVSPSDGESQGHVTECPEPEPELTQEPISSLSILFLFVWFLG